MRLLQDFRLTTSLNDYTFWERLHQILANDYTTSPLKSVIVEKSLND